MTTPQKLYAARCIAKGACRNCGQPRDRADRTRCITCREKDRIASLNRYNRRVGKPEIQPCSTSQP